MQNVNVGITFIMIYETELCNVLETLTLYISLKLYCLFDLLRDVGCTMSAVFWTGFGMLR